MADALGPAHLADVNEAFDARLQLDEGAVAHDVDDFASMSAARRVLVGDAGPGARRLLLETQADTLALLVDLEDDDFELLVDVHDLVRTGDAAPAHVGDVQQTVDAAQVDEGAEFGDVLDDALADLARFDLGEEAILQLAAAIFDEPATADDDVAAGLVDGHDLAFDLLAEQGAEVGNAADVDLAGRQEGADADVDQQAALDLAGDQTGDDVAFLVLGGEVFPFLAALGLAVAEDDGAVFVLDGFEQDLDLIAGTGRHDLAGGIVEPFAELDGAFALVADVDPDLVVGDAADAAGDDPVLAEVLPLGR